MKKSFGSFILVLAGLLGGCTEKGRTIYPHEGDKRQSGPSSVSEVAASTNPSASLKNQNLQTLSAVVLADSRIRDPKSLLSRAVQDELITLNSMLIKNPDSEILGKYAAALGTECEDIKSNCTGLRYFRLAGNTAQVVKIAAERATSGSEAARLVLLAVELKNREHDPELIALLLEKSPQVLANTDSKLAGAARSMLDSSILLASQKIYDRAELRKFLERIKAWDLTENRLWTLSPGAEKALWSMLARAQMMRQADGSANPDFEKVMIRLSAVPNSLMSEQKILRAQNIFNPSALGAKFIDKMDDLTFLADAVFTEKISPQNAAELFSTSGKTSADLAAAIETYARLRFTIAIHESTLVAQKIFTAPVIAEQLLMHSLRQSSTVKQVWDYLENRSNRLKSFASIALKASPDGALFEKNLRSMFNSFGRSVNLISVYPHTLVLFHMLSQKSFKLDLRMGGEVNSADLMTWFFNGALNPLLDYSDEKTPLNHFEIIYAFDMAVRSKLFDTMKINVDTFMSDTLLRLNEKPVKFIETTLDRIVNRFQESNGYRELQNACAEFTTGQLIPRVVTLNGVKSSPYYGELMSVANTALSSQGSRSKVQTGSLTIMEMGLNYLDGEYAESLEKVRLDLQMYLRVGRAMLTSYTTYLEKYEKLSPDEILKRTEKTRRGIETIEKLVQRTLRSAAQWHKDVGNCYYKLNLKDFEIFRSLTSMEEEYLRQVHRNILRLRSEGISDTERQSILASNKFSGLPSNFQGLDSIDKDGYTAHDIDFLVRVTKYLGKIAPHVRVNLGSKLDLDVEMVRNAQRRRLMFNENEQEFVNSGLRAYFSQTKSFVHWHGLTGSRIISWTTYMKSLVTLYRLEQDLVGKNTIMTARQVMEAQEEVLKMVELTPEDRRVFSALKMDRRYDPLYLDQRLLRFTVMIEEGRFSYQDVWGLFDLPALLMNYEKLGFDHDLLQMGSDVPASQRPKRLGFLQAGRLYYNARAVWNRGIPMIPYNTELDRMLDESVTKEVRSESNAISGFYQGAASYLKEVEMRPVALRPRGDIDMRMSIRELLSESLPANFKASIQDLSQATQNCYVQKCVDFK